MHMILSQSNQLYSFKDKKNDTKKECLPASDRERSVSEDLYQGASSSNRPFAFSNLHLLHIYNFVLWAKRNFYFLKGKMQSYENVLWD
jgi:hypothetical protein